MALPSKPKRVEDKACSVQALAGQKASACRHRPHDNGVPQLSPQEKPQAGGGDDKERSRLEIVRHLSLKVLAEHLLDHVGLKFYAVHKEGPVHGGRHIVGQASSVGADEDDGVGKELRGKFSAEQIAHRDLLVETPGKAE